jgi:hypothetical protein
VITARACPARLTSRGRRSDLGHSSVTWTVVEPKGHNVTSRLLIRLRGFHIATNDLCFLPALRCPAIYLASGLQKSVNQNQAAWFLRLRQVDSGLCCNDPLRPTRLADGMKRPVSGGMRYAPMFEVDDSSYFGLIRWIAANFTIFDSSLTANRRACLSRGCSRATN